MSCTKSFRFATLLLSLAMMRSHTEGTLMVSKDSIFCTHDKTYLKCDLKNEQQTVYLDNSGETFEKVQITNTNHVQIWSRICVNITLINVNKSTLVEEAPSGHSDNSVCKNMVVTISNSHNIDVPPKLAKLNVNMSHISSLKLKSLNGHLVSLDSTFETFEIQEPISLVNLSFHNSVIKNLVRLQVGYGVIVDIRNSRMENVYESSLEFNNGSSIFSRNSYISIRGTNNSGSLSSNNSGSLSSNNSGSLSSNNFGSLSSIWHWLIAAFIFAVFHPANIYLLIKRLKPSGRSTNEYTSPTNAPMNNEPEEIFSLLRNTYIPQSSVDASINSNLKISYDKEMQGESSKQNSVKEIPAASPKDEAVCEKSESRTRQNILNFASGSSTYYDECELNSKLLSSRQIREERSEPSTDSLPHNKTMAEAAISLDNIEENR